VGRGACMVLEVEGGRTASEGVHTTLVFAKFRM
jgi:hypothetical protein